MANRPHSTGLLVIMILGAISLTYLAGRVLLRLAGEAGPSDSTTETHAVLPARAEDARFLERPEVPSAGGPLEEVPGPREVARRQGPLPLGDASRGQGEVARPRIGPLPPEERILSGRLILPSGFPPDEELSVVLLPEPPPPPGLHPRDELGRPPPEPAWQARVASDGLFELPVPQGWRQAWLDVRGRYHFLDRPVELTFTSLKHGAEFDLPVQLGTWVRGRLAPPEIEGRETELPGAAVYLVPDFQAVDATAAFDGFEGATLRQAHPTANGEFEFRGVPGDRPWRLAGFARGWLPAHTETFRPVAGVRSDQDLHLAEGLRLAGRVVDQAGRGLASARVRAHPETVLDPTLQPFLTEFLEVSTAPDGGFELRGLPRGSYTLIPSLEAHYAPAGLRVDTGRRGRDGLQLALPEGESLAGRVLWSDGEAPEGAVLVAIPEGDGANAPRIRRGTERSAPILRDGLFEIRGLAPGAYTLRVEARRWTSFGELERSGALARGVPSGRTDVELVLQPLLPVRGRVVGPDGRAIRAFEVLADPLPGLAPEDGVPRTGFEEKLESRDGTFRLQAFARGTWELSVRAPGYAPAAPVTVELPEDTSRPLEFVLSEQSHVAGRVVDPDGLPVAGARVRLVGAGGGRPRDQRTDLEGRFEFLGPPPGSWLLVADSPTHAPSPEARIDLGSGEVRGGLELTLRRGGTILGWVPRTEETPGRYTITAMLSYPPSRRTTRTDREGRFRLDRLHPGTWRVWSTPLGGSGSDDTPFANLAASEVLVRDGEETSLRLGPAGAGRAIQGSLLVDGRPRSGLLLFVPEGKGILAGRRILETDGEGLFTEELDGPGRYLVTAVPSGARGQTSGLDQIVEIPAGTEPHALQLSFQTGGISGRVLAPDSTPLVGVEVELTAWGPLSNTTPLGGTFATDTTGSEGRFAFPFVPRGAFSLSIGTTIWSGEGREPVVLGRRVQSDVFVTGGERQTDLAFRLREGGGMAGRVVDPDGRPVSGATVYVRASGGAFLERFSSTRSDRNGRFRFPALEPGQYTVLARTAEGTSEETGPLRVVERKKVEQELVLRPGVFLRVAVQDEHGEPIEAALLIRDAAGRQVNGLLDARALAVEWERGFDPGERVVGPLPRGTYSVIALGAGSERAEREIPLESGESRKIILRFGDAP